MLRWINRLEIIIISLLLSIFYYFTFPIKVPKNIHITGNYESIISKLEKREIKLSIIDKLILKQFLKPYSAWIYLGKNKMTRLEFLYKIISKNGQFKKITLIPGETTVIFFKQLSKSLDKNSTKLKEAFDRLSLYPEAGILANSYNIPLRYDEEHIINYLVNLTNRAYKKVAKESNVSYEPKSWERVLTIASIVQKEAGNRKEMPLIASVIYNRLKKNMRLQMDGTLNYGIYSHIRITPQRIKNDKTTYNTYHHRGLPNQPVCNVSILAIKAALNPAKSKYLYFFRNNKGGHDFSKDYKTHLKRVKAKRKELREERKHKITKQRKG